MAFQQQHPKLSSFELIAQFYEGDYQGFANFLWGVQQTHIKCCFSRVMSTFCEQDMSYQHVNYFFEALRFLMSENSTSNIRQLMKLRLETA